MTLDKPVKTYLMAAILAAIQGLSEIKQVKYGASIPIDQDTALYPFTVFYDEPETSTDKNRVTFKDFDLYVATYAKKTSGVSIMDLMDQIAADVEDTLRSDETVLKYARRIVHARSEKHIPDDEETGISVSVFKVTYAHEWKNTYGFPEVNL
jgi:hypothetical protein